MQFRNTSIPKPVAMFVYTCLYNGFEYIIVKCKREISQPQHVQRVRVK